MQDALIAGRYRVERLLGVGGMGSVYRAHDLELDELVALKMLRRELVGMPGILERFRREVKLARRVTHPNVARTFDIGEHEGERFLTMELIDGESLGALLERKGRLPIARVVELTTAICDGLSAAHAAGVVHRDLKPDNVLLGRDGRVVLTDFGIARACMMAPGDARTAGLAIGTPEYMAPEQLEVRADMDGRVDLYALGVMLYEMLVGERPFTGDSPFGIAAARLVRDAPDPREKADVPDALARMVVRLLARAPGDRPATAREVASALSSMTLPAGLVHVRVPSVAPPRKPRATRVAVLPVERAAPRSSTTNRTPTSGAFALGDGVGDLVASLLVSLPNVVVRTPSFVPEAAGSTRDIGRALDAQLVVDGHREGDALQLSVTHTDDSLVLWSSTLREGTIDPFAAALSLAGEIARLVGCEAPAFAAEPPPEGAVRELLLRARVDARRPGREATDRAIARFEQAIARAPDDPWVNAGYALALSRRFAEQGGDPLDAMEAEAMATAALARAPRMVDAWVARARIADERGDALSASRFVQEALAIAPGRADAHLLRARLLSRTGGASALDAFALASSLDDGDLGAALEEAVARARSGDFAAADRLLAAVEEHAPARLDAMATIALWSGDPRRLSEARTRIERRMRGPLLASLNVALRGSIDHAERETFEQAIARADGVPGRMARAMMAYAEALAAASAFDQAATMVTSAVSVGFDDLALFDRAASLKPLRARPGWTSLRHVVAARAHDIQIALTQILPTLDSQPT